MSFSLAGAAVRGILLDVEGTTTPVDFVTRLLFPFARERVRDYLAAHPDEPGVREDLQRLRGEQAAESAAGAGPPGWIDEPAAARLDSAVRFVHWLMDRDRKSTGLKSLQGRIWERGYVEGLLQGRIYDDVPRALRRWRELGLDVRIFSSGSVLAQRLLFSRSEAGDLSGFLDGYFDTGTGPKNEPASYRRIAGEMRLPPPRILFVSDAVPELEASLSAGLQALHCERPGNRSPAAPPPCPTIRSFDEILG